MNYVLSFSFFSAITLPLVADIVYLYWGRGTPPPPQEHNKDANFREMLPAQQRGADRGGSWGSARGPDAKQVRKDGEDAPR
jgi:hypothetical protein